MIDIKIEKGGKIFLQLPTDRGGALRLGKRAYVKAAKIAKESITDNVKSSKRASGQDIQANKRSTRLRKERLGHRWNGRIAPLVDDPASQRFTKTTTYKHSANENQVVIGWKRIIDSKISRWLQSKDTKGNRNTYLGWFEVSEKGMEKIRDDVVAPRIKALIRKNADKTSRSK